MKEAYGNLWTFNADVRVITTNGFVKSNGACVMGRGCALEARNRFPGIDHKLGNYIRQYGNRVFRLLPDLASFPVKHHWRERADLELIATSALQLVQVADKFGWERIVLPRPGCGNGQLAWDDVRPLLVSVLDDRFTVITFGAMTRVVHCKREPYDVYIGRPSMWGNPFSHKDGTQARWRVATREEAVAAYEKWIKTQPHLMEALPTLRGKALGCWCKPAACHGDILARLAEG